MSTTPTMRAKFSVWSTKESIGRDGKFSQTEVEMHAVYGSDGSANAQWSKYTPSANLTMNITNENLRGKILPGQEYFLDFTLAEPVKKD